jgi:hypothetical protein
MSCKPWVDGCPAVHSHTVARRQPASMIHFICTQFGISLMCMYRGFACNIQQGLGPPAAVRPPLMRFPALEVVDLGHNLLTGSLPISWPANMPLRELALQGNNLSGSTPTAWLQPGSWPHLEQAQVWGNPGLCGPHPQAASGYGRLCLDTTGTALGAESPQGLERWHG